MAEKKEAAEANARTMVFINGLSPNMIKPAPKIEDGKIVRDGDGKPVPSDTHSNVAIFDVNDTMYSFRVPNSYIRDAKESANKNIMLYEEEGKKLNVTVRAKGSEEYKHTKMLPSELHNIQEEMHLSRQQKDSVRVYLNGFNPENKAEFSPLKNSDRTRIAIWEPNGFEDGSPRRHTLSVSNSHIYDDKFASGKKMIALMSDSEYFTKAEPTRGAELKDYVSEKVSGQDLADWNKESRAQARDYAKAQAATAEAAAEAPAAEAEVELDV